MSRLATRITWCNGFRLNGKPATKEEIIPIFESRRFLAWQRWVEYENQKSNLPADLTFSEHQHACQRIANALGI